MAISDEEQKLREEARKAILKSVQAVAAKAPSLSSSAGDALRGAAEAYAIVVESDGDEPDKGGTF